MPQNRLTQGPLLDANGHLVEAGWHTSLIRRYDRKMIRGGALRIKEWDYYCAISGDIVLALTIADNSYMSLDSVSLINLKTGFQHTWSAMDVLTLGKRNFPATSLRGDVAVEKPAYALRFENDGKKRTLTARVDDFKDGKPLTARLMLTGTPRDSMVIATPFPKKKTAFYYNQKINCLIAEGDVTFDGRTYTFDPEQAMAVLDWGRGVWTYSNTWYWASASGYQQGHRFGMNLGYGFGDTSAASENMLFVDGIAHKLDQVDFGMPQDFMQPWHMQSNDGRLNLTFTPILDRASRTSVVVIESDQHQVFGRFDGEVVLDDGTVLPIRDLVGFAEKVKNRW